MAIIAATGLFIAGVSLVVWRRPVTRWVVERIAFGYGGLKENDSMLGPLAVLTAVAGVLGILLGALLLLQALGGT